jgi:hypothetical protein
MSNERRESILICCIMLCLLGWFFGSSPKPDPTQCDIPSSDLVEHVATFRDSLTVQPVPIEDPKPIPSPSDKPSKIEILVFIAPKGQKCEPCERWKRCEMQKFMDADWKVGIIDEHPFIPYPRFEIIHGSKRTVHVGYLSFEQAKGLVK